MALTSTIFNFDLHVSDMDRDVYVSRALAVARHPSETTTFMLTRVIAFALEYREELEFSRGLSDSDEPALWAKDMTGTVLAWIEVGSPSPERVHRARKRSEHVAIYTTRDPTQLLVTYQEANIFRADSIALYSIDPVLLSRLEPHITKRTKLSVSRSEGMLYCDFGHTQFDGPIHRHPLALDSSR